MPPPTNCATWPSTIKAPSRQWFTTLQAQGLLLQTRRRFRRRSRDPQTGILLLQQLSERCGHHTRGPAQVATCCRHGIAQLQVGAVCNPALSFCSHCRTSVELPPLEAFPVPFTNFLIYIISREFGVGVQGVHVPSTASRSMHVAHQPVRQANKLYDEVVSNIKRLLSESVN